MNVTKEENLLAIPQLVSWSMRFKEAMREGVLSPLTYSAKIVPKANIPTSLGSFFKFL
jgi:hypothetical protein